MNNKIKALKAAFPHTIPIFTGFIFIGIAYGVLMESKGYGFLWSLFFSMVVFAGSSQYVAITFLTSVFNPVYALLMSLMINARHLFYGISLIDKFKDAGKLKPFLIYGLCDETFSVVCSAEPPEGVDKNKGKNGSNSYISYLGQVLPYAAIGMLVVYCLKSVNLIASPYGVPEAISIVVIVVLHYRKENSLLSIGVGTVLYMVLVQFVFV